MATSAWPSPLKSPLTRNSIRDSITCVGTVATSAGFAGAGAGVVAGATAGLVGSADLAAAGFSALVLQPNGASNASAVPARATGARTTVRTERRDLIDCQRRTIRIMFILLTAKLRQLFNSISGRTDDRIVMKPLSLRIP